MESFEKRIGDVFDFNLNEEVENYEVITEGIIEKAKQMAKKALSVGVEKVLPPEWLKFVQEILAAYKSGGVEAAANVLASSELGRDVIKAYKSGALERLDEDENKDEPITEQSEEMLSAASEIGGVLSTGASIGLVAIAIIGSIVGYKVVKAFVESAMAANKRFGKSKNRRR